MEQNFPVIPIFRPREVHPKFRNEIPENVCSIRSPTRNSRNFWSNGKRPIFHISRLRPKDHLEPAMVNSSQVTGNDKMAVEVPPLRSLQDFITDAQFTAPTLHDRDRMDNRMINNLIYYQTNYFLCAIIIFIPVG